jgi:hypothetical protein
VAGFSDAYPAPVWCVELLLDMMGNVHAMPIGTPGDDHNLRSVLALRIGRASPVLHFDFFQPCGIRP